MSKPTHAISNRAASTMNNSMLPRGLLSASGKPVVVKFDGGLLSSDGGVLALREVEQRLGHRSARRLHDRSRAADQDHAQLGGRYPFRLLMISAGYEDGNDANSLRRDPMFRWRSIFRPSIGSCARSRQYRGWKESAGRSRPAADGQGDGRSVLRVLRHGSQTDHAGHRRHVRCGPRWSAVAAAVQRPLRRIRISADRRVRRRGRFITAVLRPAKRPSEQGDQALPGDLLPRAIRAHWPNTEILLRADSHYCGPEVLDWCRASGLDYILGIAPTTTLRRHVEGLESQHEGEFRAAPRDGKLRRFEFFDGAQSWSRVERIIARIRSEPRKDRTPASSSPI